MKNKISLVAFLALLGTSTISLQAKSNSLSETACGTVMCLVGGVAAAPEKCGNYLYQFFKETSTMMKNPLNPREILNARKKFLNYCDADDDFQMKKFKESVIPEMEEYCNADVLNSKYQSINVTVPSNDDVYDEKGNLIYPGKKIVKKIRINPNLSKSCILLQQSPYSVDALRLNYTCEGEYYTEAEWRIGRKMIEISKKEFDKLKPEDRTTTNEWILEPKLVVNAFGGQNDLQMVTVLRTYYFKLGNNVKKKCWTQG